MLADHLNLLTQHQAELNGRVAEQNEFSDMDIIHYQALLMSAGGTTFSAMYSGEMAAMLGALVHTAHIALEAVNCACRELPDYRPPTGQSYKMLAIMQNVSEKIHLCSLGKVESYLGLYYYCSTLSTDFLNADFNKAFQNYHQWRLTVENITNLHAHNLPDLTDCLYE